MKSELGYQTVKIIISRAFKQAVILGVCLKAHSIIMLVITAWISLNHWFIVPHCVKMYFYKMAPKDNNRDAWNLCTLVKKVFCKWFIFGQHVKYSVQHYEWFNRLLASRSWTLNEPTFTKSLALLLAELIWNLT